MRHCAGPGCTSPLEGRRLAVGRGRSCLYCPEVCRQRTRRNVGRAEKIAAVILARPRCMICSAPIRYGAYGVRFDATTCGKKRCVAAKRDWFGPRTRLTAPSTFRRLRAQGVA